MNKEDFLSKLEDVLQVESSLNFDIKLNSLEEWDSISKMTLIAFLDKNFNMNLTFNDIEQFNTIADIAEKVGIKL